MFGAIRAFFARRRERNRIAALTEAEREAILAASPYEAGYWQGEGVHITRKGVKEFDDAYVEGLGEIDRQMAEDWLIARYFAEGGVVPAPHGPRSSA